KRTFVDLDGPGLQFAFEESQEPCPPWGHGVSQAKIPHLFLPIPARDPAQQDRRVQGKPLLYAKLTRFADGHYVLGISMCQIVCDGKGATRWFADVHRLYTGEAITDPPEFMREPVVALADMDCEAPSQGSGRLNRPIAHTEFRERFFEPVYTYFAL